MVRGLGAFQMAQMKHRDARVFLLCQHLRAAIDVLEQIASEPYRPPEKAVPERGVAPVPIPSIPSEKITYTIKEAALALGVGKTTIYKTLADGKLTAIKLGSRTLIPASALNDWIAGFSRQRGSAG